ncbi:MAG: hypothetical protein ACK4R7_06010, partial [Fervidobacterium sp.]
MKKYLASILAGLIVLFLLTSCAELFNQPPRWNQNSYTVNVIAVQEVTFSLADKVSDPNNDPIT